MRAKREKVRKKENKLNEKNVHSSSIVFEKEKRGYLLVNGHFCFARVYFTR